MITYNGEKVTHEELFEIIVRKRLPRFHLHNMMRFDDFDLTDDNMNSERSFGIRRGDVIVQYYDDLDRKIVDLNYDEDPVELWFDMNEILEPSEFRVKLYPNNRIIIYDDYIDEKELDDRMRDLRYPSANQFVKECTTY